MIDLKQTTPGAALPHTEIAPTPDGRVSVVVVTMNRRDSLMTTLGHLAALPEEPPVIVVDNGSTDGTAAAVRARYPDVRVVALTENRGAAARTEGVRLAGTPYIAFADDDSWWAAGSLRRAADHLDAHPRLALLGARIVLGDDERPEPTCELMAASPLPPESDLPGPSVLGFIACGAVVRRDAYLAAGGFHQAFGVGGEETLLALDLASAGHGLAYVDDVVAHHHPSPARDRGRRRRIVTRNDLWLAWLRRPVPGAMAETLRLLREARGDQHRRAGIADAVRGLSWVLRERRVVPPRLETALRQLSAAPDPSRANRTQGEPTRALDVDSLAVSVVIPTYRRDDLLLRLLERLARQDFPPGRLEVIVVDDARGQSVPRLVGQFAAEHPELQIRALAGPGRGPASARNLGWRAATGEVIAFIDDDAYPAGDGWLRAGIAPFADPCVAGVDGPVRVPMDDPPTDFQRNVQGLEQGTFLTCNAFYRRDALARVDGFDERFTVPFREDSDLQFRVEAGGGRLVRSPEVVVIHPAPPGRFGVSLRLQRYSMYNALLYKKHPARYRTELRAGPPLHYYAIVAAGASAVLALLTGRRRAALVLAVTLGMLDGRFFLRRVRGTSHRPLHLLDMALTSVLIPPLSLYWRLRGAVRFRVLFY